MRRGGGKEPYRIPRRPVSGSANSGRSGGAKVHRINAAHTAASTAAPATYHTGDARARRRSMAQVTQKPSSTAIWKMATSSHMMSRPRTP